MDHNGQQQQEEQRRATACPKCDLRPAGEKYVYVRRGDYYPREPRCDECYADAAQDSSDRQTERERDAGGFYAYSADTSGWLYGAGERPSSMVDYKKLKERK